MNATAERSWWQRNLKWVITAGVLLVLLFFGLFIAAVLLLATTAMRSNDVHRTAMEQVSGNPEAVALLGTPVEPGWLSSGSIDVNPRSGTADLSIPVSGPLGRGDISVVAHKSGGTWYFSELRLEVEGRAPIELRTPEQIAAAEGSR
jgi:hypothetical protein